MKKTISNILNFVACLGLIQLSYSQSGAVVVKDENGVALAGVYVIDQTNPSKVGVTTFSKFKNVELGFSDKLTLKRHGYKTKNVDLANGRTVSMEREAYPNNYVYFNSLDGLPSGYRTNEYEIYGNFDCRGLNGFTSSTSGAGQTRFYIDPTQDAFGSGKSLRVFYPKGKVDSKESGVQWRGNLNGQFDELYASYWVKFSSDFNFTLGGKLPGLGGSPNYTTEIDEFSGKLMWRDNGKLEFYLHPTDGGVDDGQDGGKIRGWWDKGGQATLQKNKWEYIEIYYKLNTPGLNDGYMMGWINGVLKGEKRNVSFRGAGQTNVKLNQFFFSTFFGGDATYAPPTDLYAWYDDFRVSKTKIGMTTKVITTLEDSQSENTELEILRNGDNYILPSNQNWALINGMGQIVKDGFGNEVSSSGLPVGQYFIKYESGTYRLMKID